MCVHVNVCAQTPFHACVRFPVCLWDSSLPSIFSKMHLSECCDTRPRSPCPVLYDVAKKLCAVERKELAVTWVNFALFFPLLFWLTPP